MALSNGEAKISPEPELAGKTVVVAVSAGIAAYKAVEVVSRLRRKGAAVIVCMSPQAVSFVAPLTFEALSGGKVMLDPLGHGAGAPVLHVDLAARADMIVHVPASADMIARLAQGTAADLPTSVTLSSRAPVLIVPAMETGMWQHPATQANIRKLESYGYRILHPAAGMLASGASGVGRMQEPETVVSACRGLLAPRNMEGVSVLVTAGPTQEPWDPVRYWTNRSSGKMGYALAEAARDRGASVLLISGPTELPAPYGVQMIRIRTAREMHEACMANAPDCGLVIKAAAVADYRPEETFNAKVPKDKDGLTLSFVRNPDILMELGQRKKAGQLLVGFAAETGDGEKRALEKLRKKNCDYIVHNDVLEEDAGFGTEQNRITVLTADGRRLQLPLMEKYLVAAALLDFIAESRATAGG